MAEGTDRDREEVARDLQVVVQVAYRMAEDVGRTVEGLLRRGTEEPLDDGELVRVLRAALDVMQADARRRGDTSTVEALEGQVQQVIDRVLAARTPRCPKPAAKKRLALVAWNGIGTGPVFPRPVFHGRDVAMNCGFVKLSDLELWDRNERLEIHLGQFAQKHGRRPTSDELISIMLSKMSLPGVEKEEEFKIPTLARSIAINGVRKPPIIDVDGTLLDGNRRVTACLYILHSDEFTTEQKRLVEYLFVWQLTEHATDDERNAVVVSLNFEDDCKQDWPEYVKARKVYEDWQAMLALEPRPPSPRRQAEMKRELSKKFALGPEPATVTRYLKMVEWANDFEEHLVQQKGRDEFAVKHKANKYFQYFDELAKGGRPGGVAHSLEQDESFKHLVFELLCDGKFKNWNLIRHLKHIANNNDARDVLQKARDETDMERAAEYVDDAVAIARRTQAEERELGANTRVEAFVKFLEELPVRAFRDTLRRENLRKLLDALRLVEVQAKSVLGDEDV